MPRLSIIHSHFLDDNALPVEMRAPPQGLGPVLIEILRRLRSKMEEASFARHEEETLEGEALAFHLPQVSGASVLLNAFRGLSSRVERAVGPTCHRGH